MKLKVFISSRNNDPVILSGKSGITLTDLRRFLKKELEAIKLFDKDFLEIKINEDFGAAATKDSYETCLQEVIDSDFVIALYNGASGWAPTGIDLGICHAELDTALNVSARKTAVIDISSFFNVVTSSPEETKRNNIFKQYLTDLNLFNNPLKLTKGKETEEDFKEELLKSVKAVIYRHLGERINLSNAYFNIAGDNKISLNWKKLKYTDRDKNITGILKGLISQSPDFKAFTTTTYSIPDNMSVEDAKSFTGRPFLKDQDIIDRTKKGTPQFGPLHFIGVYGNATEIQVKGLIGFPDITTIKEDFGIYVWEQNTHVQLIFLTECKTPDAVKSKFLLFNNWCKSNGEYENIAKRAQARYMIMKAINEAKKIVS